MQHVITESWNGSSWTEKNLNIGRQVEDLGQELTTAAICIGGESHVNLV